MDYNFFEGWGRLFEAAESVDQRAALILTIHAALEREMDVALKHLLPRGDRLGNRLGFPQKIDVLAAAWTKDPDVCDRLCAVLVQFNNLRNAIAHGDKSTVRKSYERLIETSKHIGGSDGHDEPLMAIAVNICAVLGEGPSMAELQKIGRELGEAIGKLFEGIKRAFAPFGSRNQS